MKSVFLLALLLIISLPVHANPPTLPKLTPEQEAAVRKAFPSGQHAGKTVQHKPVPYVLCGAENTSTQSVKRAKIFISTRTRDMSGISALQLAETAYAALQYYDARLSDYALVNVLLMESCFSRAVPLARAQVGNGTREVWAMTEKAFGPGEKSIKVPEAVYRQTKGVRTTNDIDYAVAGRQLGLTPSQAKKMHFEIGSPLELCPLAIGTQEQPPSQKK